MPFHPTSSPLSHEHFNTPSPASNAGKSQQSDVHQSPCRLCISTQIALHDDGSVVRLFAKAPPSCSTVVSCAFPVGSYFWPHSLVSQCMLQTHRNGYFGNPVWCACRIRVWLISQFIMACAFSVSQGKRTSMCSSDDHNNPIGRTVSLQPWVPDGQLFFQKAQWTDQNRRTSRRSTDRPHDRSTA